MSNKRDSQNLMMGRIINLVGIIVIIVANLIIYYRNGGMVYSPDSASYIGMSIEREPLYPICIFFFRLLFGTACFAVLFSFQVIIGCVLAWYFVSHVKKYYNLSVISTVIIWMCVWIYYGLLAVIFPKWEAPVQVKILTEGLTYPLFLVWIILLILYCDDARMKTLIKLSIVSTIMIMTRNSLMFVWIIDALVVVYAYKRNVRKKNGIGIKSLFLPVVVLLATVLVESLIESSYYHGLTGKISHRAAGPQTMLPNVIRLADEDDLKNGIGSEQANEVFRRTYKVLKENGALITSEDFDDSLADRYDKIYNSWNFILFETYVPIVDNYAEEIGVSDPVEIILLRDSIAKEIIKPLLKRHISQWIKGYFSMWYDGYKVTVCPVLPPLRIMDYYTIFVLIMNLLLFLYKRKEDEYNTLYFSMFFSIMGVISSTTIVLYVCSRYALYNFILFYMPFIIFVDRVVTKNNRISVKAN